MSATAHGSLLAAEQDARIQRRSYHLVLRV